MKMTIIYYYSLLKGNETKLEETHSRENAWSFPTKGMQL